VKTIREARSALPPPALAWKTCVAFAALARLHDEEVHRFALTARPDFAHFHFEDGGGQDLDAVFARAGVFVRGFDHESPMSPWAADDGRTWPGLYDGFPAALGPFVVNGALLGERGDRFPGRVGTVEATLAPATFLTWWERGAWQCGPIVFPTFGPYVSDGADYLIDFIFNPETWIRELGWERSVVEGTLRHDPAHGTGLPSEWGYATVYSYFQ
jgi:hypothetical protein